MNVILYKDLKIEPINPFNEAATVIYDGLPALTNGHLMFTKPDELPNNWKYQPLNVSKEWIEKPKPAFPVCDIPNPPLVAVTRKDRGMYFTNGQKVNISYFRAVQSVYPNAEWFADKLGMETMLCAKVDGEIKAFLMPLRINSFPPKIAPMFEHLNRTWYLVNDTDSDIVEKISAFRPFGGYESKKDLAEHIAQRQQYNLSRIKQYENSIKEDKQENKSLEILKTRLLADAA